MREWLTPARRALIAGGGCLACLAGMLVQHAWPLIAGESIYLKVRPVDPRDLFRGDYVVLGYDIATLSVGSDAAGEAPSAAVSPRGDWWDALHRDIEAARGEYRDYGHWRDTVLYVQLEEHPGGVAGVPVVHRAVSVSDRPQPGALNLRGLLRDVQARDDGAGGTSALLTMHYGIDAFFVQEGTGREIEEAIGDGEVYAIVAVTSTGRARLRDLVVDGRRWSDRVRDRRASASHDPDAAAVH